MLLPNFCRIEIVCNRNNATKEVFEWYYTNADTSASVKEVLMMPFLHNSDFGTSLPSGLHE